MYSSIEMFLAKRLLYTTGMRDQRILFPKLDYIANRHDTCMLIMLIGPLADNISRACMDEMNH